MVHEVIIIGGGPAGLSAAIYLGRFLRKVLVIDKGYYARWNTPEVNENYLGFPQGIHAQKLRELGVQQAKHFGAQLITDEVTQIEKSEQFSLTGKLAKYEAKSIIFATGVTDHFELFEHWKDFLGISLFWCIVCDGHKVQQKRVVVVGSSDAAASTALQFTTYTSKIQLITNSKTADTISSHRKAALQKYGISLIHQTITSLEGSDGKLKKIILADESEIAADYVFNEIPATPNSQLAKQLGVACDTHGYIQADRDQRTNVPSIYAAGDVTKLFAHQIGTAVHEGATAAITANYDLYPDELK